jgi:hypothetical protein
MYRLRIGLIHTLLAGFLILLPLSASLAQEEEPAVAVEVGTLRGAELKLALVPTLHVRKGTGPWTLILVVAERPRIQ